MNIKDNVVSEEKALMQMARICSRKEYSPFDILQKLLKLQLNKDEIERIIAKLKKENYLNEERFARSFVTDKIRFNGWGVKKIEMHLRYKQLSQNIIDGVLSEYSNAELNSSLQSILEKKWKQIKGESDYEKKGKLIKYTLGKGFKMSDIISCIERLNL